MLEPVTGYKIEVLIKASEEFAGSEGTIEIVLRDAIEKALNGCAVVTRINAREVSVASVDRQ